MSIKGQAGMKECPICGSIMVRGLVYWMCSKRGCPGLIPIATKPAAQVTVVPNGFVSYRPDGSVREEKDSSNDPGIGVSR